MNDSFFGTESYWSRLHARAPGSFRSVGYPALGEGFNRVCYRMRRLPEARRLLERTAGVEIQSVLEAGVGTGVYGALWRSFGIQRWVGVDISQVAVERLAQTFPEGDFYVADLTQSKWADTVFGSKGKPDFELVSAIDVLYHLLDDDAFEAALASLARRVRTGGHLLVSDVFVPSSRKTAPNVRRRALDAYTAILRPLGFELTERTPVFAILADPIPRPGFHPVDFLLLQAWRVVQKLLRTTPERIRLRVGALIARVLAPIDRVLCRMGVSDHINLELAVFRRR